ncbi:LysR family transcriptional regulator [Actinomycetospora termitidis]|uniref:LysR family transcriptional regulator n=1 Tax=Actinomycetospora termitidis TaxID=3053470 RepID=A0ABT7M6N7_9PSEU|nr:LysR family transcriptional regulator [Actinomycetospora sp. Odt1-22]MDL5156319.1 LysR family transcriptional regulator [Actinomycetospora sp. Odt1-22]
MTLKQLIYFLAVADTGRFVQAAAEARVAQPTLSRQVQALEDDLGETLFTRGRDHVTLTSAGETLLPLARRIVADVETARLEIAELADLRRGRLRLGATPSLCVSVVADVLAVFHDSYPGISLQISEGGSQDLVTDLEDGQLDLALVIHQADRFTTTGGNGGPLPAGSLRGRAGSAPGSSAHAGGTLGLTPVLREELVAVSATAGHAPLDDVLGDHAGIAEIARHPLVINRPGYELREAILSACAAAGVTPRIAVEGGEMDAVLRMVERGLGVAIVPSLVLAGRSGLRTTRLDGSGWTHRTIALAHRTDVSPTRAAEAFRETLLAVLARTSRTGGLPPGVRFIHPGA